MQAKEEAKEVTPAEKLKGALNYSIRQYRNAVKWLRDAKVYKASYSTELTFEGKSWKQDTESDLAKDAEKAYREAVAGVFFWRKRVDFCNAKLIEINLKKDGDEDGTVGEGGDD